MPSLTKFFGRAASDGAGFALGVATAPTLAPAVQELVNTSWDTYPNKPLVPGEAAAVVAEDVEQSGWGANEAAQHGTNGERFAAMVKAMLTAPGVPQLLELHRRGAITDAQLAHGFRKAKLEGEWDAGLTVLLDVLLSPSELATARQQGFISDTEQHAGAALHGISGPNAELQYEIAGLPPGVVEGLQMLRRKIIDEPTFRAIVREGHTKTKYTDALLQLQDVVLSPSTYATLHLKGWIDEAAMIAGGALSGESADNMRQMYLSMGRPAAPGQLWTAWARGVDGPAGTPMDEAQFTKAIAESDIRPEYAPMLWGIRFAYPPLFQITRLVTAGTITPATAVDWAKKDRYAPEVVAALQQAWEQGGATTSKGLTVGDLTAEYEGLTMTEAEYVKGLKELGYTDDGAAGKVSVSDSKRRRTARNQLIGRARSRYTGWHVARQAASDALRAAGIAAKLAGELLTSWDTERDLNVHTLTEAQVKRAYGKSIMDKPTAVERLTELGLAPADIETRLAE